MLCLSQHELTTMSFKPLLFFLFTSFLLLSTTELLEAAVGSPPLVSVKAPPVPEPLVPPPPVYNKPPGPAPPVNPPPPPQHVFKPPPTLPTPPIISPVPAPPPYKPTTPPPPVSAPPLYKPPTPPKTTKDCYPLCVVRCKLHSRRNVCLRACVTCCDRCKCVPPGQYGNREKCGKCYVNMTTHGGKPKCP